MKEIELKPLRAKSKKSNIRQFLIDHLRANYFEYCSNVTDKRITEDEEYCFNAVIEVMEAFEEKLLKQSK